MVNLRKLPERLRTYRDRTKERVMASCATCCYSQGCIQCKKRCGTVWKFLNKHSGNVLLVLLILFMAIGILMGVLLRDYNLTPRQIMYLAFPGDLLMRMLRMLILPLIISSLIAGLANLDMNSSGKMGGRAVLYYMATTFLAVVLGIILVVSISPGTRGSVDDLKKSDNAPKIIITSDKILDLIRSCFPDNLITSTFQQTETVYTEHDCPNGTASSNEICQSKGIESIYKEKDNVTLWYTFKVSSKSGLNILGLLIFSIAFGIILGGMGDEGKPLKDFFNCLSEVSMKLVNLVIWYSPIGICFLITAKLVEIEDLMGVLTSLAYYMMTVLVGLAIHGLIVLPLIYFIFVRKNPFKYIIGVIQAIVTAFATSSSSATLPVTMRCLEENNKIDKRVVGFVIPVGATINMDGTALYEAVAALFIAQLNGITMPFGDIVTTSITATIASIGAAGVPSAGLITMIIVLNAVGLPDTDVAYILAIDWFLDRFRTAINVLGDSLGAGIVNHYSEDELEKHDHELEVAEAEMHHELDEKHTNGKVNTAYDGPEPEPANTQL